MTIFTNHGRIFTALWPASEVFPEGIHSATAQHFLPGQTLRTFGIGLTRAAAVAACCRNIAYYQRRLRWDRAQWSIGR